MPHQMTRREWVLGCLFIPFHAIVLPFVLVHILAALGILTTTPHTMLIWYALSFIFLLVIMLNYLRTSFSNMCRNFGAVLFAVITGYLVYRILSVAAMVFLSRVMQAANPNTEAVVASVRVNFSVMVVVAVVLAPIVEEAVFRGALFGTLRQKNRLLAYAVSAAAFGLYHLIGSLLFNGGFDWRILLLAIQYIPAGVALALCFERSGTVWSPILLHAGINLMAIWQFRP